MSRSFSFPRHQALVLGASMSGLLAARVLSEHFEAVTLIEKDPVERQPQSRKGQAHTRHLHGLLPSGVAILRQYFPGILDEIRSQGGQVIDFAGAMSWFAYGGMKKSFVMGVDGVLVSRPLLEHLVRERVLALPNVRLFDGTAIKQVVASGQPAKVTGVLTEPSGSGEPSLHTADLLVDATGRASHTPQWLQHLGYGTVPVSEVKINVGYTTRIYQRNPADPRGSSWMGCTPRAPQERRFGGAIPIEGNRWMVTVGGWHGDHAPQEEEGYLRFVKSLPHPHLYDIVSTCAPLSEFASYRFPVSTRRHYEKLTRFPGGLLVLGDAVSSFNPIYGQGMSSALLQAAALGHLLQQNVGEERLAHLYFRRIAPIIHNIWLLATAEDFRFPQTTGPRPLAVDLVNRYIVRVHRATVKDEVVGTVLLKVLGLLQPPAALFHPRILWRMLRAGPGSLSQ